jgi:hypothetical protein
MVAALQMPRDPLGVAGRVAPVGDDEPTGFRPVRIEFRSAA